MRGLPVSCAFGCPHLWLFAPLSTDFLGSCALGKHFGVQALMLLTLSVSFAFDLVTWRLHRIVTRAAPALASASATVPTLACDPTWLRLNCILIAIREFAAKMYRTSKTATRIQLLRIILVLLIATYMAVLVVFTTNSCPRPGAQQAWQSYDVSEGGRVGEGR